MTTKRLLFTLFVFYSFTCCIHSGNSKDVLVTDNTNEDIVKIIPTEIHITDKDDSDKQWLLDHIFSHSTIDNIDFHGEGLNSLKFIDTDSNLVKVSEGKIELPCKDTIVILEDSPEDEYGYYSEYEYVGKLSVLNSYLILGNYIETSSYQLISAENGENMLSFSHLILSPDGKHMITGEYDGIDSSGIYLCLYKIQDNKPVMLATLVYDEWKPEMYTDYQSLIWIGNSVYIPMVSQSSQDKDDVKYMKLDIDWEELDKLSKL
ncbi:MAG: hypothetical protein QM660_04550 [Dysgonomonas sp.]